MDKLVRAVAIAVVCFFVVLGLTIGTRMDQNTIALLGGTTIGLLIAAPCAAIVTYLAVRNRDDHSYERNPRYNSPMPQNPPQYWVVPQHMQMQPPVQQQLPPVAAYGLRQPTSEFVLPAVKRRFYMIGETGDVQELDDAISTVADPNYA
jgi:hypothetical protein